MKSWVIRRQSNKHEAGAVVITVGASARVGSVHGMDRNSAPAPATRKEVSP
jgi:hypothetical protein